MIKASDVRLNSSPATKVTQAEILVILPLADLKAQERITASAEETRLTNCIYQAFYRLDGPNGWLNRAILSQQWLGFVDEFDDEIEIPLPPTSSVDQIRYRNTDGDWTVLATTVYGLDTSGLFSRIYKKKDQSWPDVYQDPGSVEITFTAGWTNGAEVLSYHYNIRKAIGLLAAHYFWNTTPTFVEPRLVEVPRKIHFGLMHTIGQYRIVNDHS